MPAELIMIIYLLLEAYLAGIGEKKINLFHNKPIKVITGKLSLGTMVVLSTFCLSDLQPD